MLCPSCNTFRPANNGPCPYCNAPSPLMGEQHNNGFAQSSGSYWGGPMTPSASGEWDNAASPGSSQEHDNSLWAQVMAPQLAQGKASGQLAASSALPVPYTGGQQPVPYMTGADSTIQLGGAMLPAIPSTEGPIYVPPMYTKPRAIIPRYRIISGLISFIVVIGLLCAGGIYYAQATGKLTFLRNMISPQYQNIQPSPAALLPTPTATTSTGPASNVINSVATASTIDPNSGYPKKATNSFTVNQKVYLTYSVHSNKAGTITVTWYTNGHVYFTSKQEATPPKGSNGFNGNTDEIFAVPLQGMVEIYWNGQLAAQLYFVVEPN